MSTSEMSVAEAGWGGCWKVLTLHCGCCRTLGRGPSAAVTLRLPILLMNNSRWQPSGSRCRCRSDKERRRSGLPPSPRPLSLHPPSLTPSLIRSAVVACSSTAVATGTHLTPSATHRCAVSPRTDWMLLLMLLSTAAGCRRWSAPAGLLVLCLCLAASPPVADARRASKIPRCPATCSCTKDSAFCVDTKAIPKSFPPGIISL